MRKTLQLYRSLQPKVSSVVTLLPNTRIRQIIPSTTSISHGTQLLSEIERTRLRDYYGKYTFDLSFLKWTGSVPRKL
jgi:hypothetical protein